MFAQINWICQLTEKEKILPDKKCAVLKRQQQLWLTDNWSLTIDVHNRCMD